MTRETQIKEQAKAIMDTFFEALEKSNISDESIGVLRDSQTREPHEGEIDLEFKQNILKNAPQKDQDHIIAEKKSW